MADFEDDDLLDQDSVINYFREKRICDVFQQWIVIHDDPFFVEHLLTTNNDIIDELTIKIDDYLSKKKISKDLDEKRLLIKLQDDAYKKSIENDTKKQNINEPQNIKIKYPTVEELRNLRLNHFKNNSAYF